LEKSEHTSIPLYLVPVVALGFATTQISWSLFNLTVPVILSDDFGIELAWVGFIMTWDNILAFFIQPTVGTYSDRVRTRWGRRLPFIIPGVIFGSILFFLLSLSRLTVLFLFLMNIVIFNFVMALYRAPSSSLMPDLVKSEKRSMANGIGNFTGGIAAGLSLFISSIFLRDNKLVLAYGFTATAMLLCLFILINVISENDEYKTEKSEIEKETEVNKPILETVNEIAADLKDELNYSIKSSNKSLIYMILAITSWFMAVNSIEAFYSTFVWKIFLPNRDSDYAAGVAGNIIFIFPIVFVTFAVIGGLLGQKIGRIKTSKIGAIIMIFGIIIATTIRETNTLGIPIDWENGFRLSFIFAGSGWGLVTVNSIVIVWEHTKDNGVGTGLYYAFTSLAAVLGPSIAGLYMSLTGIENLFIYSTVFFLIGAYFAFKVTTGEIGDKEKIMEERGIQFY
jgi:Na+/melibiose symporter-like transporter